MTNLMQIKMKEEQLIEFLFLSDIESELHPGEDPKHGVYTGEVLEEMLKEARCQGNYSHMAPPHFILSNGDEDSRFDKKCEYVWNKLENLPLPCYHVFGNHEPITFGKGENGFKYYLPGDQWRKYFKYEDTYYAWEYCFEDTKEAITFIVLDTWCMEKDEVDGRWCYDGGGIKCSVINKKNG